MKTVKEIEKLHFDFPDRLSKIISDRNLSYRDVTKMMPISAGQVQKWCEGESKPDLLRIMLLANALEISLDELLGM